MAPSPDVAPPLPEPDALTAFFWEGARRHELWLQRCTACGFHQHRPRPLCKQCHSFELAPARLSGRGVVYSFTVAVQAFHPWFADRLPYVLAVVELEEQEHLKLLTNIVDCEVADVSIGMPVEVAFVERADVSLPVFRPSPIAGGQ